jgi:hypothetical protein
MDFDDLVEHKKRLLSKSMQNKVNKFKEKLGIMTTRT